MFRTLALSLAATLLPLSAAAAVEPDAPSRALGQEAGVVFPGDMTIRNWRADGERGLWIQDRRGGWYYGQFAGLCRDIDFAHSIGIETRGTSRLDRFAAIVVRGERCPLVSFVTSAPPPSKDERKTAAATDEDAAAN